MMSCAGEGGGLGVGFRIDDDERCTCARSEEEGDGASLRDTKELDEVEREVVLELGE